MQIIVIISLITMATCGLIHDSKQPHQATSFQSIHMEHFHAVPTYVKKGHMQYLADPISTGKTESKVEVHHGSKHDPGYAFAAIHSDIHGHQDGHKFIASGDYVHEAEHQEEHPVEGSDEKQYGSLQYQGEYSGEVEHDVSSVHREQNDYSQHNEEQDEPNHDANASYYSEGQASEESGHQSYEQERATSAEHY